MQGAKEDIITDGGGGEFLRLGLMYEYASDTEENEVEKGGRGEGGGRWGGPPLQLRRGHHFVARTSYSRGVTNMMALSLSLSAQQ